MALPFAFLEEWHTLLTPVYLKKRRARKMPTANMSTGQISLWRHWAGHGMPAANRDRTQGRAEQFGRELSDTLQCAADMLVATSLLRRELEAECRRYQREISRLALFTRLSFRAIRTRFLSLAHEFEQTIAAAERLTVPDASGNRIISVAEETERIASNRSAEPEQNGTVTRPQAR